jgi:hypothetical protein
MSFKKLADPLGLFSKPDVPQLPAPAAPPPPPTIEDASLKGQQDADMLKKRRGRAATILTGQDGAAAPNVATKALLGS